MRRKVRIAGTVTYLNENGQRLPIPLQICELDDGPEFGPTVTLIWKDENGNKRETELTEEEYAYYYSSTKAIKDAN